MLQLPTPRCHSSLALILPRHSRETRLCVWYSSEATRLKTEWGGEIRPDRLEQIESKASEQGPIAPAWLTPRLHIYMSRLFTEAGNIKSFHSSQWVLNSEGHEEAFVIFCVMYFGIQTEVWKEESCPHVTFPSGSVMWRRRYWNEQTQ